MTFKAEITARLGWNWTDGVVDNDKLNYQEKLLNGSGADQAEAVWHKESQTLAAAATVDYDLTNLTRTVLGDTITTNFLMAPDFTASTTLSASAKTCAWAKPPTIFPFSSSLGGAQVFACSIIPEKSLLPA